MLATNSPNVNAISIIDAPESLILVKDEHPNVTRTNVPKNSANNERHIRLFSVISDNPMILSAPEICEQQKRTSATNKYIIV